MAGSAGEVSLSASTGREAVEPYLTLRRGGGEGLEHVVQFGGESA